MKDLKEYIKSTGKSLYDIMYLFYDNEEYASNDNNVSSDLKQIVMKLKLRNILDLYYEDDKCMFDIYPNKGALLVRFSYVIGHDDEIQVETDELPRYSKQEDVDEIMKKLGFTKEKNLYILKKDENIK